MFKFVEKDGKYCLKKNGITILEFAEEHGNTKISNGNGKQILSISLGGKINIGPNLGNIISVKEFEQIPVGLTFYTGASFGTLTKGKVYFKLNDVVEDSVILN